MDDGLLVGCLTIFFVLLFFTAIFAVEAIFIIGFASLFGYTMNFWVAFLIGLVLSAIIKVLE